MTVTDKDLIPMATKVLWSVGAQIKYTFGLKHLVRIKRMI